MPGYGFPRALGLFLPVPKLLYFTRAHEKGFGMTEFSPSREKVSQVRKQMILNAPKGCFKKKKNRSIKSSKNLLHAILKALPPLLQTLHLMKQISKEFAHIFYRYKKSPSLLFWPHQITRRPPGHQKHRYFGNRSLIAAAFSLPAVSLLTAGLQKEGG